MSVKTSSDEGAWDTWQTGAFSITAESPSSPSATDVAHTPEAFACRIGAHREEREVRTWYKAQYEDIAAATESADAGLREDYNTATQGRKIRFRNGRWWTKSGRSGRWTEADEKDIAAKVEHEKKVYELYQRHDAAVQQLGQQYKDKRADSDAIFCSKVYEEAYWAPPVPPRTAV